ncbi:MAG: hypothetical protein AAGH89_01120 [Verrucomicrobiota bacterium]
MKKLATISVSILCALSLVHFASAEDKGGKGGEKGGKGGGSMKERAEMMMKQGDTDGDGKLSMKELVALLESGKAGGKGGKGGGKSGKGGEKGGKGGKGGEDEDQGGGQVPTRPEAE